MRKKIMTLLLMMATASLPLRGAINEVDPQVMPSDEDISMRVREKNQLSSGAIAANVGIIAALVVLILSNNQAGKSHTSAK
jgi:hypothetical protein